ncbi:hypothetical protein DEO72_LG4g1147 [Vigna unguiculata]|uniref:Uncharacterized protein n=1 Tax=Vigna unguiculata TaxID=3917 RepID=A0A4D6LMY7_VIGUN|nr:hypothetical protein DEO72_LG4g1147 [Vigna unguiculata]
MGLRQSLLSLLPLLPLPLGGRSSLEEEEEEEEKGNKDEEDANDPTSYFEGKVNGIFVVSYVEGTELEKDPLAEEMPQVQLVVHVAKPTFEHVSATMANVPSLWHLKMLEGENWMDSAEIMMAQCMAMMCHCKGYMTERDEKEKVELLPKIGYNVAIAGLCYHLDNSGVAFVGLCYSLGNSGVAYASLCYGLGYSGVAFVGLCYHLETLRKGKNSGEAMPDKEKLYSGAAGFSPPGDSEETVGPWCKGRLAEGDVPSGDSGRISGLPDCTCPPPGDLEAGSAWRMANEHKKPLSCGSGWQVLLVMKHDWLKWLCTWVREMGKVNRGHGKQYGEGGGCIPIHDERWRVIKREFRQAMAKKFVVSGTASAWRWKRFRQAVVAEFVIYGALGAWRVFYKASGSALEVRLLEFLELWLGTYPLSCGSG